jgi:hypothetical protein
MNTKMLCRKYYLKLLLTECSDFSAVLRYTKNKITYQAELNDAKFFSMFFKVSFPKVSLENIAILSKLNFDRMKVLAVKRCFALEFLQIKDSDSFIELWS